MGAVRDKADPTPLERTSISMAATMIKVTAIDFRLRVINILLILLENRLNAQIS